MTLSELTILTLNCSTLKYKLEMLEKYLADHDHPDVVLLQEPGLNQFDLKNYAVIMGEYPTSSRGKHTPLGTAVLIKRGCFEDKPKVLSVLKGIFTNQSYEGTFVQVTLGGTELIFGSIYIPPCDTEDIPTECFAKLKEKLFNHYPNVILGGDLNTLEEATENTKVLRRFVENNDILLISPLTPTHVVGSTLDHFLVKGMGVALPSGKLCRTIERFSDHFGVRLDLFNHTFPLTIEGMARLETCLENGDVPEFLEALEKNVPSEEDRPYSTYSLLHYILTDEAFNCYNLKGWKGKKSVIKSRVFCTLKEACFSTEKDFLETMRRELEKVPSRLYRKRKLAEDSQGGEKKSRDGEIGGE